MACHQAVCWPDADFIITYQVELKIQSLFYSVTASMCDMQVLKARNLTVLFLSTDFAIFQQWKS